MTRRRALSWGGAFGLLALTALLASSLLGSLAVLVGYPPPELQTSDENDACEVTVVFSTLVGLALVALGAGTVRAFRLLLLLLLRRDLLEARQRSGVGDDVR